MYSLSLRPKAHYNSHYIMCYSEQYARLKKETFSVMFKNIVCGCLYSSSVIFVISCGLSTSNKDYDDDDDDGADGVTG